VIVVRGDDDGLRFELRIGSFEEADYVAARASLKTRECLGEAYGGGWDREGIGVCGTIDLGLKCVDGLSAGGEELVGNVPLDGEDGDVPHFTGQCIGWAAGGALGACGDWLDWTRDSILNHKDSGDALFA